MLPPPARRRSIPFGLKMVAPVIYTFGNAGTEEALSAGIVAGDVWWCQGYSEPGSGSDLASLKTRAVREGDHYVVNGHKTWTTLAPARRLDLLPRAHRSERPKQQQGISFLLIDMKSPGVTVQPDHHDGRRSRGQRVALRGRAVPVENRIGEENQGWTYAKYLLTHERTNIAGVGASKRELGACKRIAAQGDSRTAGR